MGRERGTDGGQERCIPVFGGKPDGKRPLVRLRCRCEDNIKMDLQHVGWGTDWTDLAQFRDR
jgi:hypothetical protein